MRRVLTDLCRAIFAPGSPSNDPLNVPNEPLFFRMFKGVRGLHRDADERQRDVRLLCVRGAFVRTFLLGAN